MYPELYRIWKQELEDVELTKLSPEFYAEIANYIRKLSEEARMLDKRSVKASLLKKETQNAKRMVRELIRARCRKLMKKAAAGEKVTPDILTGDEANIFASVSTFSGAFQLLTKEVLQGRKPKIEAGQEHKRAVLRFLAQVPAIIGADMKSYGPFQAEDVASLPMDNAKILVKQRLAESVEVG
jgi:DNA replication factor GINS